MELDRSRKAVLVPSALLALCSTATFFAGGRLAALAALSVALLGIFSWAGNLQTAITEIIPQQHVAILYGITGAVGTLVAAISQLLIGRIVDRVGYEPVFIGLGTGLLLALVLVFAAGEIAVWQPGKPEPAAAQSI
jgi:MFS family permease